MGAEHLHERRLGHVRQLGRLRVPQAPLPNLIDEPEEAEVRRHLRSGPRSVPKGFCRKLDFDGVGAGGGHRSRIAPCGADDDRGATDPAAGVPARGRSRWGAGGETGSVGAAARWPGGAARAQHTIVYAGVLAGNAAWRHPFPSPRDCAMLRRRRRSVPPRSTRRHDMRLSLSLSLC